MMNLVTPAIVLYCLSIILSGVIAFFANKLTTSVTNVNVDDITKYRGIICALVYGQLVLSFGLVSWEFVYGTFQEVSLASLNFVFAILLVLKTISVDNATTASIGGVVSVGHLNYIAVDIERINQLSLAFNVAAGIGLCGWSQRHNFKSMTKSMTKSPSLKLGAKSPSRKRTPSPKSRSGRR